MQMTRNEYDDPETYGSHLCRELIIQINGFDFVSIFYDKTIICPWSVVQRDPPTYPFVRRGMPSQTPEPSILDFVTS